jgi:hypothetical protein
MNNRPNEAQPPRRRRLSDEFRRIDRELKMLNEKFNDLARAMVWMTCAIVGFSAAIFGRVFANEIVDVMQRTITWVSSSGSTNVVPN